MSTPSEPKTGLPNFLAVIGIAIAVIGVLAGLAQLEPVRNLACEKGSILCKREHKVEFFKISYSGSAPERSAWDVVLNGKRLFDRNYRNRDNTECIDDDGMSTFLAVNQAIREEKGFHISYGSGPSLITTNPYPATDWRFETHPLDVGKNISMDGGDIILFHLISRYTLLVRDIKLELDTTVDDGRRQLPEQSIKRTILLRKGSHENQIFCQLFIPNSDEVFNYRFSFEDDVWDRDDTVTIPLKITNGSGKSN